MSFREEPCSSLLRPSFPLLLGSGPLKRSTLRGDDRHQVIPRLDERLRAFILKLGRQGIDVDSRLTELRQHFLTVTTVWGQDGADFAVIGEGLQCGFRHGVYRQGRSERLHIENVGRLRILRSSASPKEPLGTSSGVEGALPARRIKQCSICLVGTFGDSYAELIAKRI